MFGNVDFGWQRGAVEPAEAAFTVYDLSAPVCVLLHYMCSINNNGSDHYFDHLL